MKKIVIFGGSGGLGRQLKHLMNDNYDVTALSSDDCDVRSFNEVTAFFATRKIDIVINLAGFNADKFIHKLDMTDLKNIEEVFAVNMGGCVNIAANCLPGMRERRYGRIIFISSVLATRNVPGTSLYSSSKAFIDRFVVSISDENIRCGITANSIQLGYFDGGMTHKLPYQDVYKEKIGLKRWGCIDELYNIIEYLISNEYHTGDNLKLNGGICS